MMDCTGVVHSISGSQVSIFSSEASGDFTTDSLELRTNYKIIAGSYREQNAHLVAIMIEHADTC